MLTRVFGPIINSSPALKRAVWGRWYQFLARSYKNEDWTFMNYGYANLDGGDSAPPLYLQEGDEPDRHSILLYHRTVGDADLRGKDVLEVGSGRGGGSSFLARYHNPASMLGIDYSESAAALSSKRHTAPNLSFRQGDAENIPSPDASFDAVVNVESSHCYGSMERFLGEVVRVLRPGGQFLWVDMRPRGKFDETREQFRGAGLGMLQETEITGNVVHALDLVTDRKREAISKQVPKFLMPYFEDFAGVRGTRVYEALKAGDVQYWRCALQKPTD